MTVDQLKPFYRKLQQLGFSTSFVKRISPSWWDDSAAESPSAVQEFKLQIARCLGLDVRSALDNEAPLEFRPMRKPAFKASKNKIGETLESSRAVADAAARIAIQGCVTSFNKPESAASVRRFILEQGNPWVSFQALLEYCWSSGIPVLHLTELPGGRMHGMVAVVNDRPVIVLGQRSKWSAWLLFTLAHELGHIACQHLDEEIVDVEVNEGIRSSEDPKEAEANAFALTVLTGNHGTSFHSSGKWLSGEELADGARAHGEHNGIDPGHIALNYAKTEDKRGIMPKGAAWAVGNKALDALEDPHPTPLINAALEQYFDPDSVPEDSYEFLAKITGME